MPTKTTTGTLTKLKQPTKGKITNKSTKTGTKASKEIKVDIKDKTDYTFDIEEKPPKLPGAKSNYRNNAMQNPIDAPPRLLAEKMAKLKVIYDWEKIDLNSDDAVEVRISDYFNYCIAEELRPTVEGLGMALGIDRRTLWDWEASKKRATMSNSRADIIKKAKDYIAFLMSDMVMDGKINPITWIFYAKNYFGMKDQQDIIITPNNALQPTMTAEEIAEKVRQDVVIDTEYTEINE